MGRRKKKKYNNGLKILVILFLFGSVISTYYQNEIENFILNLTQESYAIDSIPEYSGKSFIVINDNIPNFNENDKTSDSYEKYSNLDFLGRAGVAVANIGKDLMPTEERESIGMIKPSGWHTIKYDIVDGKYLYNRCHLIGFQLTGENANEKNLITCTRQMNTGKMLEYENKIANYIRKTNNHVLYRVTPIYIDNNRLASGVQMEALSIEDNGRGIKFNVYVYNVQDGIEIDYKTGESKLEEDL
ncbi:MAG: hypothetical protein E7163_05675 [Firmicutes bacterium]|nr:hypothetical protein [Bacillota bacterium]